MADRAASVQRAESLARIAKVQAEMVKLAEWRIAAAARQIEALGQDRARLETYVGDSGGLGVPIARAALRSLLAIDRRKADAEQARVVETERLDGLRRRDKAIAARAEAAAAAAASAAEKAELSLVIEAWLAQPATK